MFQLLPDNYFDCITFNDVLEHTIDPTQLLSMVKTKLGPKGIVIASIPNVLYVKNMFNLLVKKDWEYTHEGILDSTHLRFFTKKSMKRMFQNAGYVVIKQKGINPPSRLIFKLLNILTLGIIGEMKYMQYVCLAKPFSQNKIG